MPKGEAIKIKSLVLSEPANIFIRKCLSNDIEVTLASLTTGPIFIYFAYHYRKLKRKNAQNIKI
jgi:hypothetical protein